MEKMEDIKWAFEASQKAIIFGMKNELAERRIGTTSYYETKNILHKMEKMNKSVLDQFDSISKSTKSPIHATLILHGSRQK